MALQTLWLLQCRRGLALAEAGPRSGVPLFRGGRSCKDPRRQPLVCLARRCRVGTMPLLYLWQSDHLRSPLFSLVSVEPFLLFIVSAGSTYYRQVLRQGRALPCRSCPRRALTPPNGALQDSECPRPSRGVSARSDGQFLRAALLSSPPGCSKCRSHPAGHGTDAAPAGRAEKGLILSCFAGASPSEQGDAGAGPGFRQCQTSAASQRPKGLQSDSEAPAAWAPAFWGP